MVQTLCYAILQLFFILLQPLVVMTMFTYDYWIGKTTQDYALCYVYTTMAHMVSIVEDFILMYMMIFGARPAVTIYMYIQSSFNKCTMCQGTLGHHYPMQLAL